MQKKAQNMTLGELPGIALTFVVVGVVVAIGMAVQTDVGDDLGADDCAGYWNSTSGICQVSSTNSTQLSSNPLAYNATRDAVEATGELADKLPLIGMVVAFAVLLGIMLRFLAMR